MSISRDNYIGDPNYPAPWATKTPREGLRDVDEARIVSLAPDVCLTPVGSSVEPIPYPVVDFCGHDENYTPSVRFTRKKAMVMRSCTTHVHGDAPGVRKGAKSGTVESICEPIGHADQVRAEGSHVIRHLDRFYMNNRNTEGEAIFVRGMQTYAPPVHDDPVAGSLKWQGSAPVQLAQASTGTMTDTGGSGWFSYGGDSRGLSGGTAGTVASNQTQTPSIPRPVPKVPSIPKVGGGGLLRRGIWGMVLEEMLRDLSMPKDERAAEGRAFKTILSKPGQAVITQEKLLGGRQPVTFSNIFKSETWDFSGKYGIGIDTEERIPLANDILSSLAGKPVDIRTMSDAEVSGLLLPFQGLSDDQIEQKLKEVSKARKQEDEKQDPKPGPQPVPPPPLGSGTRIAQEDEKKRCRVDTYRRMEPICRAIGMQAHHIVPDWTLRWGTRDEAIAGQKRIDTMPGYWNGQSICVVGNARTSGTEHNEAHLADGAIEALGSHSTPPFSASLDDVKRESIIAMTAVRPDCAKQILDAVNSEFANSNQNQLLRAKQRVQDIPESTMKILSNGRYGK